MFPGQEQIPLHQLLDVERKAFWDQRLDLQPSYWAGGLVHWNETGDEVI